LHLTHRPQACACVRAVSWQPAPTTAPGGGEAAHSHRVPVLHGPRRRLAQRARTGEPARRQPAVHLITPAPVSRRHEPLCQQRERLGVGMRARSAQRCRAHARLLARSLARALSLSRSSSRLPNDSRSPDPRSVVPSARGGSRQRRCSGSSGVAGASRAPRERAQCAAETHAGRRTFRPAAAPVHRSTCAVTGREWPTASGA